MIKKHIALSTAGILMFILFTLPTVLWANKLTLKQVTRLALHSNRDLKVARLSVSIAQARLVQAGLWSNPNLNLTSNDDRLFNNEGEYSRSAGFTQAFPLSGRIARQKKVARVDMDKARTEIKEAERQLSAKVANTFYALVVTERRLKQQSYLLNLNHQLVQVTHNRYQVAEVSEVDGNTAQLEYERIHQEKHLLESTKIAQVATLNQLLGRPFNAPLILDLNPPKTIIWPKVDTLKTIALKNRPDRQAVLLTIHRANASAHLARAERLADWTLGLGVQQDKIVVERGTPQPADRTLGVSLSIPLPVLNQNQGLIAKESATGTQAILALRALNLVIETQIASQFAQLKLLQHTIEQTQQQSLQLTMKNVQLANSAYKNGQLSLLNLVQVQRQQNDVQLTYLTNLEQYLQTYVALCTSIGVAITPCDYLS
jgi:outer membrane protein, heavy metal efflux system